MIRIIIFLVVSLFATNAYSSSKFDKDLKKFSKDNGFIDIKGKIYSENEIKDKKNSILIILIKPQFEANKDEVDHGGIIKNVYLLPKILDKVIKNLQRSGLNLLALKKSEPKGKKGNQEFFTIFKLP